MHRLQVKPKTIEAEGGRRRVIVPQVAVARIPHDRVPFSPQMPPDLMRPPRARVHGE